METYRLFFDGKFYFYRTLTELFHDSTSREIRSGTIARLVDRQFVEYLDSNELLKSIGL